MTVFPLSDTDVKLMLQGVTLPLTIPNIVSSRILRVLYPDYLHVCQLHYVVPIHR